MSGWVRGVRLGVDVGTVRVGVAVCDPDGILATPLVTLSRDTTTSQDAATEGRLPADIVELARLVREHEAVDVVVGLPVTLKGTEGPAAASVRSYCESLSAAVSPIPVRLVDERMSTVVASRRLSGQGVRVRRQRPIVDQMAAVEILQGWLDAHRRRAT